MAKAAKKKAAPKAALEDGAGRLALPDEPAEVEKQMTECVAKLSKLYGGAHCYPLLGAGSLNGDVVEDVYADLRDQLGAAGTRLVVVVDSGGGDIHAAFNLAQLFRRYGSDELVFIVPRWAKSAATLLVCAGDRLKLTPVAELGPLDPQISQFNPLEDRLERFSPLHLESTLQMIRDEYDDGNAKLAHGLMQRLQFPLTLGSILKSLEVGEEYLRRLLASRMLSQQEEEAAADLEPAERPAAIIAKKLTRDYADHGFCITCPEVESMGLIAEEADGDELETIWRLHQLHRHQQELTRQEKRREMEEAVKNLPPEILKQLPDLVDVGPARENGGEGVGLR